VEQNGWRTCSVNAAAPDRRCAADGRLQAVIEAAFRDAMNDATIELMQDTHNMKRRTLALMLLPVALGVAAIAHAHNAICSCFENDDASITCEGGFSDGGKAVGVPVQVVDQAGKVLLEGVMDKSSSYKFARPKVPFRVKFNAGEGHVVTIDGRDIEK
jgi:hypothetical protein